MLLGAGTASLAPWKRTGVDATLLDMIPEELETGEMVVNQGTSRYICEIPKGGMYNAERHMYEEIFYVVKGRGATSVWYEGSPKHTFEWQEGSVFSIPLNAWHEIYNASGEDSVRLYGATNAPTAFNLYASPEFIFDSPLTFPDRFDPTDELYFSGKSTKLEDRFSETNFIPNAPDMALYGWKERGAGGINAMLQMGKNKMGNHISEFPVGTYKKAHRHGPGAHLVLLSGDSGFSLLWTKEDRSDIIKCDWKVGSIVIVPNDNTFHQHFNSGTKRARYMALCDGDGGYNMPNRRVGGDVSIKDGGIQVEYEDEAREIHAIFEDELAKNGVQCNMKAFIPYCTGVSGITEERYA